MLEQVTAAFECQDYKTAARLLKQLVQQSPNNPWVKFYVGRLHEATGKPDAAEAVYRKLLQETANPKLALQARQGLQRLEQQEQERRQMAIANANAQPQNTGLGFLVLEPMTTDQRKTAIPAFSRLMKLDAYTARIHLSHRGWRLYRSGAVGEMQVYSQELNQMGIPAFAAALADIQAIRVFRVQYLQTLTPQPVVVCVNEHDQVGSLSFRWDEVGQVVEGMVPVFEEVVDLGPWNKLKRKETTQDYLQLMDLHLPGRQCILRFCDRTYQFPDGVPLQTTAQGAVSPQGTNRLNWNNLLALVKPHTGAAISYSEFMPFAETAIDHLTGLKGFTPYIDVLRKHPSPWDPAFHLYSGLAFRKP